MFTWKILFINSKKKDEKFGNLLETEQTAHVKLSLLLEQNLFWIKIIPWMQFHAFPSSLWWWGFWCLTSRGVLLEPGGLWCLPKEAHLGFINNITSPSVHSALVTSEKYFLFSTEPLEPPKWIPAAFSVKLEEQGEGWPKIRQWDLNEGCSRSNDDSSSSLTSPVW